MRQLSLRLPESRIFIENSSADGDTEIAAVYGFRGSRDPVELHVELMRSMQSSLESGTIKMRLMPGSYNDVSERVFGPAAFYGLNIRNLKYTLADVAAFDLVIRTLVYCVVHGIRSVYALEINLVRALERLVSLDLIETYSTTSNDTTFTVVLHKPEWSITINRHTGDMDIPEYMKVLYDGQ